MFNITTLSNPVLRPEHAIKILNGYRPPASPDLHRLTSDTPGLSVENIVFDPRNGWDRSPDLAQAKRRRSLKTRLDRNLAKARSLMQRRTLGGDDRVVARLAQFGLLDAERQHLTREIIVLDHR
jgi:hypothetical protein